MVFSSFFLPLLLFSQTSMMIDENVHIGIPEYASSEDSPMCKKCHPVSFKNNESAPSSLNDSQTDDFTLACLTCHDGNTAQNAPVKVLVCECNASDAKIQSHAFMTGSIKSHPVLNEYPSSNKGFRSPSEPLPGEWKKAKKVGDLLRNGKVVCISCHISHFEYKTTHIRTTMNGSSLCYGCHKK